MFVLSVSLLQLLPWLSDYKLSCLDGDEKKENKYKIISQLYSWRKLYASKPGTVAEGQTA